MFDLYMGVLIYMQNGHTYIYTCMYIYVYPWHVYMFVNAPYDYMYHQQANASMRCGDNMARCDRHTKCETSPHPSNTCQTRTREARASRKATAQIH